DIYSAGAVLYEMVTGQIPFVCASQFDLMMAHVNSTPELPTGIDVGLAQVILTALAKNPSERFQTARLFRDALESVASIPSPAAPDPVPEPAAAPAVKYGLQKLVLTGLVTFLVMLLIFFVFIKISKM